MAVRAGSKVPSRPDLGRTTLLSAVASGGSSSHDSRSGVPVFVHDFVRLNLPYEEVVARFGSNVDPWLGMLVASACRNDMPTWIASGVDEVDLAPPAIVPVWLGAPRLAQRRDGHPDRLAGRRRTLRLGPRCRHRDRCLRTGVHRRPAARPLRVQRRRRTVDHRCQPRPSHRGVGRSTRSSGLLADRLVADDRHTVVAVAAASPVEYHPIP